MSKKRFETQRAIDLAEGIFVFLTYGSDDFEKIHKWADELSERISNLKFMEE
jgi:hypothetical protein